MKQYILFAGVNGAGKTTLYYTNQMYKELMRINVDETIRSFGSWKNPSDVIKAGLMCVRSIHDCFRDGISFNQETTLCGKSIIRNIRKAKNLGYRIELYYVGVASPDLAKERVHERVKQGGHGIPDEDIERRYYESLRNLSLVIPLCDKVTVFDNSDGFIKLAEIENGKYKWSSEKKPKWYDEVDSELS